MLARPLSRIVRVSALATLMVLLVSSCSQIETLTTEQALDRMTVASTKVYAFDGSLVANLHGEIDRDIVLLDQIPEHVRNAVIAIEDRRYWSHRGLDVQALVRAAVANANGQAEGGRLQGGSTLTQQLVKNLYFAEPERTIRRKLAEARITLQFENQYTKQRILEMYLNTVYFGRGVYGIQTAAQSYFRKDAADLSLAEAAFLAGLIHEPARYQWIDVEDPDRRAERHQAALVRRNVVLQAMFDLGVIGREQLAAAVATPLEVNPPREDRWRFPYFVDAVLRELGVLRANGGSLDPRFAFLGDTHVARAEAVYRGGLRIHTTVDAKAQEHAERAIAEVLPEIDKLSSALVSVDPSSGSVRALVGGRDYYPTTCDAAAPVEAQPPVCRLAKVNLALGSTGGGSGRQPGSSFKPFVLAAALDEGVSLRRSFSSSPFTASYPGGTWNVRNYEGSGGGMMPLVDATVRSVNAVYARLEIDGIGGGDAIRGAGEVAALARKMGFSFPTEDVLRDSCGEAYGQNGACTPADAVPAIALGAKEVSPVELAAAYATFASQGVYHRPTTIAKITDADGKVLYEAQPAGERALEPDVAAGVTHVLQQVIQRGTGVGARLGRPAAGKTGTSQQWRDAWFAGFVPQLATVVWVGNPIPVRHADGSWSVESMTPANGYPRRITGGSYPASIWRAYMSAALEGVEERAFPEVPERFFVNQRGEIERRDDDGVVEARGAAPADASSAGSGRSGGQVSAAGGRVPGVIGDSPARARIKISNAGFNASQVRQCPPGGSNGMRVWRQSPGGGAQAPRGSTVTIWVSEAVC